MSARVRQSVVSSICAVSGQQTASVPRARASRAHAPHYTLRTDRRAYDTRGRVASGRRAACRCRTTGSCPGLVRLPPASVSHEQAFSKYVWSTVNILHMRLAPVC